LEDKVVLTWAGVHRLVLVAGVLLVYRSVEVDRDWEDRLAVEDR